MSLSTLSLLTVSLSFPTVSFAGQCKRQKDVVDTIQGAVMDPDTRQSLMLAMQTFRQTLER